MTLFITGDIHGKLDTSVPLERGTKLKNCRAGLEEGRDWTVIEGLL